MWGATLCHVFKIIDSKNFNPRTPCGVRLPGWRHAAVYGYFNPRTPCGVRPKEGPGGPSFILFQSTHPVWGATTRCARICASRPNFNPRTPCGVRHILPSFHPLPWLFQSTHPVWGATTAAAEQLPVLLISIHAPRVGCDKVMRRLSDIDTNFNPRTPCGVRLVLQLCQCLIKYFNPRTPCGVRRRPGPS